MPTPQEEAQEKQRLLFLAYAAVFGTSDDKRTPAQKLVMADMRARGYVDRPIFVPDATGAICPLRAAQTEGRRLSVLEIEDFIRRASAVDAKPKRTAKKP